MKIRHGFVSNSSSSSFCCLTTKEISDKAEATLTQEQRDVLAGDDDGCVLFGYTLAGVQLVAAEGSSTDYASYIGSYCSEDCGSERWEELDEAVDAWKAAVRKVGGEDGYINIDIDL